MIDKGMSRLTATRLRLVLIVAMAAIILIGGTGFYFIQSYLYTFSVEVSHANENASTSSNDIAVFEKLKQRLANDSDTIKRVEGIVGDSKFYQYQDQIINDLNAYAQRSGVSITSFTFDSTAPQKAGAATTPSAVTTNPSITPIAGLKATAVAVTLTTPSKYTTLMNFIHSIEQNLTKMQLANISLTKGTSKDDVSISSLEIEVYIK